MLILELVSKELNHLAAILHVYAGGLNFIVKSLQKEQNSTNLLLWPPICQNKHAITPKWFNSLDTNSVYDSTKLFFQSCISTNKWKCKANLFCFHPYISESKVGDDRAVGRSENLGVPWHSWLPQGRQTWMVKTQIFELHHLNLCRNFRKN